MQSSGRTFRGNDGTVPNRLGVRSLGCGSGRQIYDDCRGRNNQFYACLYVSYRGIPYADRVLSSRLLQTVHSGQVGMPGRILQQSVCFKVRGLSNDDSKTNLNDHHGLDSGGNSSILRYLGVVNPREPSNRYLESKTLYRRADYHSKKRGISLRGVCRLENKRF